MDIEKKWRKKSEMIALGYPPSLLNRIVHAEGAPVIQSGPRGIWLYEEEKIPEFVRHLSQMDEERLYERRHAAEYKRRLRERRMAR